MTDFYDGPGPAPARSARPREGLGPIFMATYESECASCPESIVPGEDARADGRGSYIHADDQCEAIANIGITNGNPSKMCPRCWCAHATGQVECA